MSNITDASEQTDVLEQSSVTGGKVWTPPEPVVPASSSIPLESRGKKVTNIASHIGVIVISLNIAFLLLNVLFLNVLIGTAEQVPDHMPASTFNGLSGIEWVEMVLFGASLITSIVLIAVRRHLDDNVLLGLFLISSIGLSGFNASITLYHDDVNKWGKQYGYSFSGFSVTELFGDPNTVNAYNLKTKEHETVPIEIVDGNIVLVGAEKVDSTEYLPELKVVIENGSQYIVDESTGDRYEVIADKDELTFEPSNTK